MRNYSNMTYDRAVLFLCFISRLCASYVASAFCQRQSVLTLFLSLHLQVIEDLLLNTSHAVMRGL